MTERPCEFFRAAVDKLYPKSAFSILCLIMIIFWQVGPEAAAGGKKHEN